jgi:hypothetical protein
MNPAVTKAMSAGFTVLHVVSIAGCVREQPSTISPPIKLDGERRLAGALIEIISGPPAYATLHARQASALAAGSRLRRPRCDRTYTQADGIYYFTDLPPGDYTVQASAPQHGTRYGTAVTDAPLQVLPRPDPGAPLQAKLQVATFDAWLPVTGLRGVVRRKDTGDPVLMAQVRLRGAPTPQRTDAAGRYEIRPLVAGKHVFEVTAAGFALVEQAVTLEPGKEVVLPDIFLSQIKPK